MILVVGAIVSSLLIPYLTHAISKTTQVHLAREKKAVEIVQAASLVNRRFGLVELTLENFYKDVAEQKCSDEKFREEQRTLKERMYGLYQEFDFIAWSAIPDLCVEASVTGILPPHKIKELEKLVAKFQENVGKCTDAISTPWGEYLTKDHQDVAAYTTAQATRARVEALRVDQAILVANMAHLFTE